MSAQSRAARALLRWSQADLAKAAGLGVSTVRNFEKARSDPYGQNLEAIRPTLEGAGIEFIAGRSVSMDGGPGVRLKINAGQCSPGRENCWRRTFSRAVEGPNLYSCGVHVLPIGGTA